MTLSLLATPTNSKPNRRRRPFGSIEKLPSGRYRARFREPSGRRVAAEQTFASVGSARAFLATVEADILRRTYRAPRLVSETLSSYGTRWIQSRPTLKDSTRHQYGIDFRLHVEPHLGHLLLDRIEPASVREWHAGLSADLRSALGMPLRRGRSASGRRDGAATVARCYRLLRAILQTAVTDELLTRNPCKIAGAGEARSSERPTLSVPDLAVLARTVPKQYRALVILAGFSGLRAGEIAPLRPRDLQLEGAVSTVTVTRRFYRVEGRLTIDAPKSAAGRRTVVLPAFVAAELRRHLDEHRPTAGGDDLVFVTRGGEAILDTYRRSCGAAWTRSAGVTAAATTCGTRR